MPSILFIVPHRFNRSPGQRFRCEQYIAPLKNAGFTVTYSNIISEKHDQIFYSRGKYLRKAAIFFSSSLIRIKDLFRAKKYDIIFIYREAFMLGTTFFERCLRILNPRIIFDFDDAIWLNDTSLGNANLSWLKKPAKTAKIIMFADLVLAGNAFLADYARQFNPRVEIMPTTIDTDYHKKRFTEKKEGRVCIGWTGTSTTLKHFITIVPILKKIKEKFKEKVYFKIIVNVPFSVPELNTAATPWNLKTEIDELMEIDVGIMPLPDDDWSRGKCGFKGLQYMALEVATVMSPVGVNNEIITDGINGFLARNDEEWFTKLSLLIENPGIRHQTGIEGRKTVCEKYSVERFKNQYIQYFLNLLEIKKA